MKIAHISDLHLRRDLPGTAAIEKRRSREMPGLLDRAADAMRRDRPDLIVLSGDVLDFPLDKFDAPEFLAAGEADARFAAEILGSADCPLAVVSGNHDPPGLLRRAFGPQAPDSVVAGQRVLLFEDTEDAEHYPRREGDERERFFRALSDAESPPQIHVQHFLVWPERNAGYPHTYPEGEAFRRAVCASGRVRLVLSGHYHRGVPPTPVEGTVFAAAPAFCEAPHRWMWYEMGERVFRWRERTAPTHGAAPQSTR